MASNPSSRGQEMIKWCTKFLLVVVALLYGCVAGPSPKYYRVPLDTTALCDAPFRSHRESLRVARFKAITPLRQDSIVTYRTESALVDFSSNDRWESTPSDIVTRKLAEAFRASQIFSRVDQRPDRQPADYLIRGKILRFNRLETVDGLYGEVWLEVEFFDHETREILWSAVIRDLQKADADHTEAAIEAVSKALGQCILQIVHQVKHTTASHQRIR